MVQGRSSTIIEKLSHTGGVQKSSFSAPTVFLWGLEKNVKLNTIPEGLYLLALSLKFAGVEVCIKYLPRSYIETVKRNLSKLLKCKKKYVSEGFVPYYEAGYAISAFTNIILHGIQVYESDLDYLLPLIHFLKKSSNAPILIGGPFPTLAPREALRATGADLLLRGECESTLLDLVDRVISTKLDRKSLLCSFAHIKDVFGIGIRLNETDIYISEGIAQPRELRSHPDSIELWQKSREINFGKRARADASFLISASRGCPRKCLFCSHANGRYQRRYPIDNISIKLKAVLDGIRQLRSSGSIETVYLNFNDDDICLDRSFAIELMEKIVELNADNTVRINITSSVPALFYKGAPDEMLIHHIAEARICVLNLGTDAFSDNMIRHLKGNSYTFHMVKDLVECLENYQIINNHFWLLSGPETTIVDIVQEISNAYQLYVSYSYFNVGSCNLYILPYFGTRIRDRYPPGEYADIYRKRRYLVSSNDFVDENGTTKEIIFYDKVDPFDPESRELLTRLEKFIAPNLAVFDFKGAVKVVTEYVTSCVTDVDRREKCLKMLAKMEYKG